MPRSMSIRPRRRQTVKPIPRRARVNDLYALRHLIELARDDLAHARHDLTQVRPLVRAAELAIGTVEAQFDSIVALYNRLVVEYEPQERRP